MLTSLPSLTVTFLPEQGAVELISDCGLEGTRRIACKGQAVSIVFFPPKLKNFKISQFIGSL